MTEKAAAGKLIVPAGRKEASIYLLLFLVPIFWGGSFSVGKHVVTEVPPITTAALRYGAAGLILVGITTWKRQWNVKQIRKNWFGLLLMALTGIFAYNALFFIGLQYTSAANGSLIVATSPVFMTILAVLLMGEGWSKTIGIGMVLSLTGVFIVITNGSLNTMTSMKFNFGDLIFIGAMASWVLYGIMGKKTLKGISPLLTTTVSTCIGSLFLIGCSLFEEGWHKVPMMSGQVVVEFFYLTVLATVLGFILWNIGIQKIGASKTSAYMNLVPVNALLISVIFYDAQVNNIQIAGMALVLSGVYLVNRYKKVG
jgi:drug/metabolite transporter (DMT)-like permease